MKKTLLIFTLGVITNFAPASAACPDITCIQHTCAICPKDKTCKKDSDFNQLGTFAHLITKKGQEIQGACYAVYQKEYDNGGTSNEKYDTYSGGVDDKKFNPSSAKFGGISVQLFKSCKGNKLNHLCEPSDAQLAEANKALGN